MHSLIILQVNVKQINVKMVVEAVVWFNWRNKQEKYLSTKLKRPKQDDDIKYTYKTVASFQREKLQTDILEVRNSETQPRKKLSNYGS